MNFEKFTVPCKSEKVFNTVSFTFEYKAYSGDSFSWFDGRNHKSSGHSGLAPYCFNLLTKEEANEMLSFIIEDLFKRDLTINQFNILGSVARECSKIIQRPAPKLVFA